MRKYIDLIESYSINHLEETIRIGLDQILRDPSNFEMVLDDIMNFLDKTETYNKNEFKKIATRAINMALSDYHSRVDDFENDFPLLVKLRIKKNTQKYPIIDYKFVTDKISKWLEKDYISESVIGKITDTERGQLITFLIKWLNGSYMETNDDHMEIWNRINQLFPHNIRKPIKLMRLVTLPIEYANMKTFKLDNPAPKTVGSWSSTHFGIDSVAGVANEINVDDNTCRMAIGAIISPDNILASHQSLKRAFLSLTRDYEYDNHIGVDGKVKSPYLNIDDDGHEIGLYQGSFRDFKGGPLRQYEYVVKTTPLTVKNLRVYRLGDEHIFHGHDDPHNSGDYKGWASYG